MRIAKEDIFNTPFIGLYSIVTDKALYLPLGFTKAKTVARLQSVFGVPAKFIAIYGSQLIGVFGVANSNGLAIPGISEKPAGAENVVEIEDNMTALGNLVLANDSGALISPEFSRKAELQLRDALGVEVVRGTVGRSGLVGSSALVCGSGALFSPTATENEIEIAKSVLKLKNVGIGSLNRGSGYVGASAAGNSRGITVGSLTTPIEITRLEEAIEG